MYLLFDSEKNCYGMYEKIDYVQNVANIIKNLRPDIAVSCFEYHVNSNSNKRIELQEDKECDDCVETQVNRVKSWYETFKYDLKLYENMAKDEEIPLLFQEKYEIFEQINNISETKNKFDIFIQKYYLKNKSDTSYYDIF
jgi:hypothetical protein